MSPEGRATVAGVLLAAGSSQRMGRNKLLLSIDEESVVRRAARRALSAGLEPLWVVLGHEAERVAEELAGLPCRTVVNREHARGIASSLRCGIAALGEAVDAAVVVLADMPLIDETMIAEVIAAYRESGSRLVVSDFGGVHAPPTLYDRSLFAELRAASDERCGRQVANRHREEAAMIRFPADRLADLDVPTDYERLGASLAPAAG